MILRMIIKFLWVLSLAVATSLPVWAGEAKAVYLQETETYSVYMLNGKINQFQKEHKLGVGYDSTREKKFNITLIDRVPVNAGTSLTPSGKLEVNDLLGKPMAIPYTVKNSDASRELKFDLKGIPTVNLSQNHDDCCGCDGSCGKGCGVEFAYQIYDEVDLAKMALVQYAVKPMSLKPGIDNLVTVTVTIGSDFFTEMELVLNLPEKDPRVTLKMLSLPEGFEKKSVHDVMIARKTVKGKQQTFQFKISVNPKTREPLLLKNIIQVAAMKEGVLRYPEVTPVGWKVLQRTNALRLNVSGGLAW